jgi:hypothetical protein
MATYCGDLAANLAAGKDVPRDAPQAAGGLRRFPLPALRGAYLARAYLAYPVKDRWRRGGPVHTHCQCVS